MAKNWSDMTLEELEKVAADLDEKRAAIGDEAKLLRREIDKRLTAQSVTGLLARMSSAERAALAQIVKVEGVAGLESFGEI